MTTDPLLTTKDLQGDEYILDTWYDPVKIPNKYSPDITIMPVTALGIGTRLQLKDIPNNTSYEMINGRIVAGNAIITKMYEENGKTILIAEDDTKEEQKSKYVNKILGEIDFKQGLANQRFLEMFCNVFSVDNLQEIYNCPQEDIELLLFAGLMYLKVGSKAYRL